jgi:SAM-dependent methyltransferase
MMSYAGHFLAKRPSPPRFEASAADLAVQARFGDWQSSHCLRAPPRGLDRWESLAREVPGPILAVGCGTGGLAIELAHLGHEVVGIDDNPHSIRLARQRAAEAGASAELEWSDIADFDLGRTFSLVVLADRAFQRLTDSGDQRRCLASVARLLLPSGRAAFELTRFDLSAKPTNDFEHRVTDLFEGSAAVVAMYGRIRQDYLRQLTHFDDRFVVFHTGVEPLTFESTVTLRTVHRYEMELLLGAAGMRARAISEEHLDGGEGHEMLVVAERQG